VNRAWGAAGARRRAAWLAGYAVVTFLCFPHPLGERVLDLGIALAWLAPALLLRGLLGLAPRRAALLGLAAGTAAHAAILHWLSIVTVVYGHAPFLAGLAAPLGLGLYLGVFPALFGAGMAWLGRAGQGHPWSAACWWTALDHLRSFALSGFPWATLGYAQHENTALLGLAPYTGVYGLSFVSVLGSAAALHAVGALRASRRPALGATLGALAVLAAHAAGLALATDADAGSSRVRVAVLQGNVDQGVKWSRAWSERILARYEALAREAAAAGAELVVWPESSVPGLIDRDPELRRRLAELARETGATQLLGVVGLELDVRTRRPIFSDSAVALDARGEFGRRYDKSHLVPFGEYVPLRGVIGGLVSAVARGVASDHVTPGPGPRPVWLSLPARGAARLPVGVPICYELLFPDLVRRMVDQGAELLLAITNDAWYGRTGAPYQFLAMTAVRSAETRVWTARAANTGVSAIIDARGRVRQQTRIFERGVLVADVPLRPAPLGGSFYTRHGDVFAAGCWLASAGLGVAAWWRGRSAGRGKRKSGHE